MLEWSKAGITLREDWSYEETMPRRDFEEVVVPHLGAAFNCARWLTNNGPPCDEMADDRCDECLSPEDLILEHQTVERMQRAVEALAVDFREVIVLRELEGLSYKEIAAIVSVPLGTVMSRLSRARERLLTLLGPAVSSGGSA
jgi:RNA polymerase sigma factor (sigma-70 family)